tara:strand:- start:1142 stop:1858 length:717 start_codon:yes stop_codon:yes gene_type:complete
MCEPSIVIGSIIGAGQAITGVAEQNRRYRAQVDAVNRSNAIARQKYLNDVQISAFNDQRKGEVFTAQLKADAASRERFFRQREINQIEANRASESAQAELREKVTESMFKSQEALAKAIQAQGKILTSGAQEGQSLSLMLDDAERQMGMEEAQLNASIFDATRSYGLKQFGVQLGQYSSDVSAMNQITTSAAVAPTASFKTIKPIMQNPPEKPSALGPILGGFAAGVGAYAGLEAAAN